MTSELPSTDREQTARHHVDAAALADGDPFALMPTLWPLLFGVPDRDSTAPVHLSTDAPPLRFRPLSEYRVLCGAPCTTEIVTYVTGAQARMALISGAVDLGAIAVCPACRAAHDVLMDRALRAAGMGEAL